MKTNPSNLQSRLASLLCASLSVPLAAWAASNSDDFNDDSRNTTKWGNDRERGGVLTERNHRLEYTCNRLLDSDSNRPWILTRFPYTADWEIQIDTFNITAPAIGQVNSMGLSIRSPRTADTEVYVELYSTGFGSPGMTTGFSSRMEIDDDDVGGNDSSTLGGGTNAAVRLRWDSTTKLLMAYYDNDVSDGYSWVQLASFGLAGSGGADGTGNWNLTADDQFFLEVYGYSDGMTVSSGQMHADNFMETGGVTPNGQQLPEPTGHFKLKFPTNNPLLAAIFYLTGRYTGVTPGVNDRQRTYSIEIMQDDSGKLIMTNGMIDGLANASGSSNLSGTIGAVTTVNNEPTLQFKNTFIGTGDGEPISARITATAPVALTDTGGGTNALPITATVAGRVGDTPIRIRQMPLLLPTDASFMANAKKEWSFDLDLTGKTIGNRARTFASAQLLLPNGNTIHFPEKAVRYSPTKGYTLSFKRGTNVTVNPIRIDKKTAIDVKGLTFERQGSEWKPTAGTINYRFLGQKGSAPLLEFLKP